MKHLIPLLCSTLALASLASQGVAGTVIRLETEFILQPSKSGTATVYLDEKRLRIDSTEGGVDVTVIYVAKDEEDPFYWLIDRASSTYIEIRREDLLAARNDVKEAIRESRAKIKDLPPKQKRELEQLMSKRFGYSAFSEVKTEYTKVASGVEVGGWKCDHYQGARDGVKVEEVWAADYDELGITESDLESLREVAGLFESAGQDLPAFFRFGAEDEEDKTSFKGFPIMIVSYLAGKHNEKSEVIEIRREKLGDDVFELPEGVKKKAPDR